ncbi:Rexo1 protein [Polyporus arcularius HHB13444]|uniref:Rexo1 protein n=1 Tax=Polyporus arcularius HHB13444 TaxID=1314778 RepID=A0A5C3PSC6_9APHY|nr:Rexo1 protein [Polyporus arcularius HHB13444]
MFPALGLFQSLPCPEKPHCTRSNCVFSHRPDLTHIPVTPVPVDAPKPASAPASASKPTASKLSASQPASASSASIPAKRSVSSPLRAAGPSNGSTSNEPPRKFLRTGPPQRPVAVPSGSRTSTGAPVLRVSAAQSTVAIPVRQAMLKTMYDHFVVLYEKINPANPTLAAEHALKQEEEVYQKSSKLTYRNAMISSVAALKKRPKPDSASHPSVGTDAEILAREEMQKKMQSLKLTASQLEPYVLTLDELKQWGYITEIPPGPGGDRPHEEGSIKTCERCTEKFVVKRREEADQCRYHWGKPFSSKMNGEKRRVYTCCSRTTDEEGCETGPHVFYETNSEDLHRRHAFTHSRPAHPDGDSALEVVALDCEMIYTTGGMRVARVSVVDSAGKDVLDEFVRMDEGVEVIDFNTRFSGITAENYATAVLPLASIRESLDTLINSQTIVIGHALDNDMKTLRMIHHRCVDTVVLFPHQAGPPYRRALRSLTKEHLGRTIQAAGAAGHSSVEDSVATLDLVRWHLLNGPKPKPKTAPSTT